MAAKNQPSENHMPADLTTREAQLAIIAWQCIDGDVKIDLNKFAQLAPYKTIESARANWSRIKGKIVKAAGKTDQPEGSTGGTKPDADLGNPKTRRPRKRKADVKTEEAEQGDAGSEASEAKQPVKKALKRSRGPATPVEAQVEDGDGHAEFEFDI